MSRARFLASEVEHFALQLFVSEVNVISKVKWEIGSSYCSKGGEEVVKKNILKENNPYKSKKSQIINDTI